MDKKLLPPKNNTKELICIILCAGEGIRIRSYVKDVPKSLMRFEKLENKPILQDTILKLSNFNVSLLVIVTGHLKQQIEKFVLKFKEDNPNFQSIIKLHDSQLEYKKGPLFSFLSILENDKLQFQNRNLFVLPGDTIFDKNLLKEIVRTPISKNANCTIFFREIEVEKTGKKIITTLETTELNQIKKIYQRKASSFKEGAIVKQLIPIVVLNFRLLKKIQNMNRNTSINTIIDTINLLIKNGINVISHRISTNTKFYDIDTENDIERLYKT